MSKGKWKSPRADKKVQVGGKMNPDLAEWVKQNGGFPTVEKAVELYRKTIEDSMKTLYLAVVEMAVYGWSFESTDDAVEMALNWWESEGEQPSKVSIMELECPDCLTENDFNSCSDYHEYESVIERKIAELADDDYIGTDASQKLLDSI